MKKVFAILIILILALSAVGCAEIRVSRIMCADSSVIDRVEVVLDEEIANANGYALSVIKDKVEELLTLNGYDIVDSDNEYTVTGEIVYETLAEYREVYGGSDDDEGVTEGFLFDTYGEVQSTPFSTLISNGTVKWVKDEYFSNFSVPDCKFQSFNVLETVKSLINVSNKSPKLSNASMVEPSTSAAECL